LTLDPSLIKREVDDYGGSQPYRLVEILDKGFGMLAARDIKRGELIVSEKPILDSFISSGTAELTKDEEKLLQHSLKCSSQMQGIRIADALTRRMAQEIKSSFKRLSQEDQERIMELSDSFVGRICEEKSALGVLTTNSVSRGSNSSDRVLCLTFSRFNHSCCPNLGHVWVEPYERMYANRDIKKGEELTTAYVNPAQNRTTRQKILLDGYGFRCVCEACALTGKELSISDARRERMAVLDIEILKVGAMDPVRGIALCEEMINVMEKEELAIPALLGRVYYDAYQLACAIGDFPRAKNWINLAHDNHLISEGDKSQSTQKMAQYMANPKSHMNWGVSRWMVGGGIDAHSLRMLTQLFGGLN